MRCNKHILLFIIDKIIIVRCSKKTRCIQKHTFLINMLNGISVSVFQKFLFVLFYIIIWTMFNTLYLTLNSMLSFVIVRDTLTQKHSSVKVLTNK